MGGDFKWSLTVVVLCLSVLNCLFIPCIGLGNVVGDDCALAVARKSIPFCYSAIYDINMKAREAFQSPRRTFCCCLHGLERCLRSAFAHFGCSSENLIQEEFANLVSESLDNGDMIIDGACEDYEDDVSCQAEVSFFESAVVAFTKVVPVRPDALTESSRSSNRQFRLESLNATVNFSVYREEHLPHNARSNSTGLAQHNCSNATNTSCSKHQTDSEISQRAYLEWESSKQLVVIVTDEHGEKLVLTVIKKGTGYLVNSLQAAPDSGNDLLEWTEFTNVLGVLPRVIVSDAKEDGTMYYGGKLKDRGSIVPDKMSFKPHHMNSTTNHIMSANGGNDKGKEPILDNINHPNPEAEPIAEHIKHPEVKEQFTSVANRTPKYSFNVPGFHSEWSFNFTNFINSFNNSWLNPFSASSENDPRGSKVVPETALHR